MRKTKLIKVYEEGGCYDIPTRPDEFMAFWQTKLDKIPSEHLNSARVDIEADSYYDSATLNVEISYSRPETDEEMAERLAREKAQKESQSKRKLEQYNKLKEEFGL